MGWFADKYGEDEHPEMSAETYSDLYDKFGEESANEFLEDVQDGIYTEEDIKDTYLDTDDSREHKTDFELADFTHGGDLLED